MINNELLKKFEEKYSENPLNKVIENAIARVGIDQVSINNDTYRKHNYIFSHEIETGEMTNQKQSGRCWMFAGFNVLRVSIMKELNIESIEFSESYLQFYDLLEKSNSYLEQVIETKDLPFFDRKVQFIVPNSTSDGGYWNYFEGLVLKYGLIPKDCMLETHESSNTRMLGEMLELRLKKAAMDIRRAKSNEEINKIKEDALYKVYNILIKSLGRPPQTIEWEYKDKDKNYHKISGMTPLEFMEKYAKSQIETKAHIIADPREEYEKGRLYEVPYTVSILEYGNSKYLNVSLDELKRVTIESIKKGVPVWFGCDVAKYYDIKSGIMDQELYNYDLTLNELGEFTKADKLITQASQLTHAMVFVGVDLDENGKPIKWKVENSWGDERGKKGIFSMSDSWFDAHCYEVVVDKELISEEFAKGFEKEPIMLEYYDNYLG